MGSRTPALGRAFLTGRLTRGDVTATAIRFGSGFSRQDLTPRADDAAKKLVGGGRASGEAAQDLSSAQDESVTVDKVEGVEGTRHE